MRDKLLTKPIQGYVRADFPLNVLETTVEKFSANPLVGVLEISTEDGVLRLAISGERPAYRFGSVLSRKSRLID